MNGNECELGFEIAEKNSVFIGTFGRECWFGDLGSLSDGGPLGIGVPQSSLVLVDLVFPFE